MNKLAEQLKAHAKENYENGWDTFVECYTDEEFEEFVQDFTTWAEVLKMAEEMVDIWNERRADAAYNGGE